MTERQKAFVEAYLTNGFNAVRAAATAGYAQPEKHAGRVKASPEVMAAIRQGLAEIGMDADEVNARLALILRTSVQDVFQTAEGEPRLDWNAVFQSPAGYAIKSIKSGPHGLSVELHDKGALLLRLRREMTESVSPAALREQLEAEAARIRAQVAAVIRNHVHDPETLRRIAEGLSNSGETTTRGVGGVGSGGGGAGDTPQRD